MSTRTMPREDALFARRTLPGLSAPLQAEYRQATPRVQRMMRGWFDLGRVTGMARAIANWERIGDPYVDVR